MHLVGKGNKSEWGKVHTHFPSWATLRKCRYFYLFFSIRTGARVCATAHLSFVCILILLTMQIPPRRLRKWSWIYLCRDLNSYPNVCSSAKAFSAADFQMPVTIFSFSLLFHIHLSIWMLIKSIKLLILVKYPIDYFWQQSFIKTVVSQNSCNYFTDRTQLTWNCKIFKTKYTPCWWIDYSINFSIIVID